MSMSFMFPEIGSRSGTFNEPQAPSLEPRASTRRVQFAQFGCSDRVIHAKGSAEREVLRCGGKFTAAPGSVHDKKKLQQKCGLEEPGQKPELDSVAVAARLKYFTRRITDLTIISSNSRLQRSQRVEALGELKELRTEAGKLNSLSAEPPTVQKADPAPPQPAPGSRLAAKRAAEAEAVRLRWVVQHDHARATIKAAHRASEEARDHAGIARETQSVVRERFAPEVFETETLATEERVLAAQAAARQIVGECQAEAAKHPRLHADAKIAHAEALEYAHRLNPELAVKKRNMT